MQTARREYRGFVIDVVPVRDSDDLWDFTYHICRSGAPAPPAGCITRSRTLGG